MRQFTVLLTVTELPSPGKVPLTEPLVRAIMYQMTHKAADEHFVLVKVDHVKRDDKGE